MQDENIQPCYTPVSILKQSIVPCTLLTVASWSAFRFLRRQVRWSGISISKNFPQFVVIHIVKGFSAVSEAEVDVYWNSLAVSMIQQMLAIWSLVPVSSKLSLYIWMFSVHILLKPSLKDFEHNLTSMWNEHNCTVIWTLFGIALLWHLNGNWPCPDASLVKLLDR